MNKTELDNLLGKIGKGIFVQYFQEFGNRSISSEEMIKLLPNEYTANSRKTRTSKARRIFLDGLEEQALSIIAESGRLERKLTDEARALLAQLRRRAVMASAGCIDAPKIVEPLTYQRPTNKSPLSKAEKLDLLRDYNKHYRESAATDATVLMRKIPGKAFKDLLDRVGEILLTESVKLAEAEGPVRTFLNANPLPSAVGKRLPDNFRVFCLALNSLKVWVAAEQNATDRYLLGGTAREACREAAETCLVTGDSIGQGGELHHPVRDGRPPILLSKKGHDAIEGQLQSAGDDSIRQALMPIKRNGNHSWVQLRGGCLDLLGQKGSGLSKNVLASARSFAKKAADASNLSYENILQWLDMKGYGRK